MTASVAEKSSCLWKAENFTFFSEEEGIKPIDEVCRRYTAPVLKAFEENPKTLFDVLKGKEVKLRLPGYMNAFGDDYRLHTVHDASGLVEEIDRAIASRKKVLFCASHGFWFPERGEDRFSGKVTIGSSNAPNQEEKRFVGFRIRSIP